MATYTFDSVPAESALVAGDFLTPSESDTSKVWMYVEDYGWAAYSGDADEILLRSQLAATGGASMIGTASGNSVQTELNNLAQVSLYR